VAPGQGGFPLNMAAARRPRVLIFSAWLCTRMVCSCHLQIYIYIICSTRNCHDELSDSWWATPEGQVLLCQHTQQLLKQFALHQILKNKANIASVLYYKPSAGILSPALSLFLSAAALISLAFRTLASTSW